MLCLGFHSFLPGPGSSLFMATCHLRRSFGSEGNWNPPVPVHPGTLQYRVMAEEKVFLYTCEAKFDSIDQSCWGGQIGTSWAMFGFLYSWFVDQPRVKNSCTRTHTLPLPPIMVIVLISGFFALSLEQMGSGKEFRRRAWPLKSQPLNCLESRVHWFSQVSLLRRQPD